MSLFDNTKTSITTIASIVISFLIALLVIYFIGRSTGKAKAIKEKLNPTYPDGGEGIPAGWDPNTLADLLFDKMDGFTINKIGLDALLLQYAGLPTNDMFVAVYSVFNQKHYSEDAGTLREWIESEKYYGFPDIVRPKLYKRMDLLNLK